MKVTDKDVKHVADLANLQLTADELPRMLRDLNSILGYIDRLDRLDTGNIPPMTQISYQAEAHHSPSASEQFAYASREDVKDGLRKSLPHDVALKNAPDTDGTFFEVPKVIEK